MKIIKNIVLLCATLISFMHNYKCDYELLLHLNKTLFAYKMVELGYISAVEGEDTEHVQTFSINI